MRRLLIVGLLSIICVACSSGGNNSTKEDSEITTQENRDRIEVLYFHGKNRCITCNAIETNTKEVIESLYSDELKDGSMVYRSIDISLAENKKLAEKYEVSWSSLIINRHNNGVEESKNLTEIGFLYAKNSPEKFKEEIKRILESLVNN
ncbi:MAG: nitrophenyl compound nitroreductase subunit ArsF family protein [Bacteroidales bacterium]